MDSLLDYLNPGVNDIVITLGDYIDRGNDSKRVIDRLLRLAQTTNWYGILGNHEQMMLNVLSGQMKPKPWLDYGGRETLASYGVKRPNGFLPKSHEDFVSQLHDYIELDEFFLTHASYDPAAPIDQQSAEALRWQHLEKEIPKPHFSGKTAIVGHTANLDGEVVDFGHLICLDTFCYGGGWLSAMELRSRAVWQFSQWGKRRV
nr:metallophosphoesterase [Rhodopirellula sp.]